MATHAVDNPTQDNIRSCRGQGLSTVLVRGLSDERFLRPHHAGFVPPGPGKAIQDSAPVCPMSAWRPEREKAAGYDSAARLPGGVQVAAHVHARPPMQPVRYLTVSDGSHAR